jgi:hypothetical protein
MKCEPDALERAAMMIVLEASPTSAAPTRYVRRELIADLNAALRARGWNMDAAHAAMKERRKRERVTRQDALRSQ